MERNPYAPPNTPVALMASPAAPPTQAVLIACKLCWVNLGLQIISEAGHVIHPSTMPFLKGGLLAAMLRAGITFALTLWIVSKLRAGRNWMRLLLTIGPMLSVFGLQRAWNFYSSTAFPIYSGDPIKAAALLEFIPSILAAVLLNVRSSRAWFAATQPSPAR